MQTHTVIVNVKILMIFYINLYVNDFFMLSMYRYLYFI